MNIYLLPYGLLDQKSSFNNSTPILDSLKTFISKKIMTNEDIVCIYISSSFVKNEKSFKTIQRNVSNLLVTNKFDKVKTEIFYNTDINVYNFDSINNIIQSYKNNLIHIQNNPLKQDDVNVYLVPCSKITTLDLGLYLLPNYFEEDIKFITCKLNYEINYSEHDKEINIEKAFKNKDFVSSIISNNIKKENKYRQVDFKFDYNLDKYNIYEKILNSYSYSNLKLASKDIIKTGSRLDELINFAIALEKGDSNYININKVNFDFYPRYLFAERANSGEIQYNNLLVIALKTYIHINKNELRSFVSRIEALFKDTLILCLYTFANSSKYKNCFEFKCSGDKLDNLFNNDFVVNKKYITNNPELLKTIKKYNPNIDKPGSIRFDSSLALGLLDYYLYSTKKELIDFIIKIYKKTYSCKEYSLAKILNSLTHNISSNSMYDDQYFKQGEILLKGILALLYMMTKNQKCFDEENFSIDNQTKPRILSILNQNILIEISKLIKN